ncbi:MAG: S8 family serine peptidase [Pseudomonadota bacterium]
MQPLRKLLTKRVAATAAGLAAGFAVLGPIAASAQMEAAMRHLSSDRVHRMHHAAHRLSAHHHRADMMRMAQMGPAGAAAARIERMTQMERTLLVKRGEAIGLDLSPASRAALDRLGYDVARTETLGALGVTVDVIKTPRRKSVRKALAQLRKADPGGVYAPNTLFATQSGAAAAPGALDFADDVELAPYAQGATVGLIDTGLDVSALGAPFASRVRAQRKFVPDDAVFARPHGARVAMQALAAGAGSVVVADVFSSETGFADAAAIARALDWMAAQGVPVINLSLAGPPNVLVERAVASVVATGHVVVAAVGNEGPEETPLFPAAYPGVVGVTAVDADLAIYPKANAGPGVDIAAVGVGAPVGADASAVMGTSYAAPVVAGFLSERLAGPMLAGPVAGSEALALSILRRHAIDLGPPGPDERYGVGALPTANAGGIRTASAAR